jgi:hypothetical protein
MSTDVACRVVWDDGTIHDCSKEKERLVFVSPQRDRRVGHFRIRV